MGLKSTGAPQESCSPLGDGTDTCLAAGFSEPVQSLLLLSRQVDGPTVSCFRLRYWEENSISKAYSGHPLRMPRVLNHTGCRLVERLLFSVHSWQSCYAAASRFACFQWQKALGPAR